VPSGVIIKEKIVYKKLLIVIASLGAAGVVPMHAQNFSRLSFDMGGGVSTPLNPTGQYVGVSGNYSTSIGYNLNKKNTISGQFLWSGLPANTFVLHPADLPHGHINLYTLTANYRHHIDSIHGSPFGLYVVGGGGWYYRYANVDKDYAVPPSTVCEPIYGWWGYGCDSGGYVYSKTVAYKGSSAGGVNAGAGFTIRFGDSNWKFYAESRYHHAWSARIPTVLMPVTFGIRFN